MFLMMTRKYPDTQIVTWNFPDACLVWEHRMWSTHGSEGSGFGNAFYGDKGTLLIDDKGWRVQDGPDGRGAEKARERRADPNTPQNFLDCVQDRAPNPTPTSRSAT